MTVDTQARIVGRLLEISREFKRLKGLPPSERATFAGPLRIERRQLIHRFATVQLKHEVPRDSH